MDSKPDVNFESGLMLPFIPITLHNDAPVDRATEEADFLNFTPLAKEIAAIAIGTDGPFTMAVTAKWGHGKTSMLGLTRDLIRRYGDAKDEVWRATHTTVWFNAWQYEREEDPIIPLLLAIQDEIAENVEQHKETIDKIVPDALRIIKKLPRVLGDVASGFKFKGKLGTAAWLQLLTGLKGEIELEAEPGKAIENLRETFAHEHDAVLPETAFMQAMRDLNAISKELERMALGKDHADKPKVVVFVDDLDRCHPDAALRLLDGIKLVLNQPGFVFVLALDKTILEEFLVRRYREDFGALNPEEVGRRYVDKIIQLEIPLPPSTGRFEGSDDRMRIQPNFKGKGYLERVAFEMLSDEYALTVADVVRPCRFLSPRDVVRLMLRLRLDLNLYGRVGAEIAGMTAIDVVTAATVLRLIELAFGGSNRGDFLDFMMDQAVADRLWDSIQSGAKVKYGEPNEGPEEITPQLTLSEAIFDAVTRMRGLTPVIKAHGERWMKDVSLRRRLLEFLDPDADKEFGDLDQFTLVQNAVRRSLNLRKGEITPINWSKVDTLTLPPELNNDGLQFVARCSELTMLVLAGTQVTDLAPIENLVNITELDLTGTLIGDLSPISGFQALKTLLLPKGVNIPSAKKYLKTISPLIVAG